MRRTLLHSVLPAAVAVMMSLGIVMTAAAEPDPGSPSALVPGWNTLDRLVQFGVLPAEARDSLVRVRLAHSDHITPGLLCRRVVNAENPPVSLVERCRELNQDDGSISPAAACRRVAAATDPAAALVERCRAWLSTEGALADVRSLVLCRRIASGDSVDATLVERCRTLLTEFARGRPADHSHWGSRAERSGEAVRPVRDLPSTVR